MLYQNISHFKVFFVQASLIQSPLLLSVKCSKKVFLWSSYNLNIVKSKAHQHFQLNSQTFFCLFVSDLHRIKFPEGSFASTSEAIREVRLTKTKTRTAEDKQDSNPAQDCSKDCSDSKTAYLYIPVHTDHSPTPHSYILLTYHWVQC